MLKTKSEVDQHVQGILRKVRSDHERNLRCFFISQLYLKVQDYDKARRYVSMYLSIRDDSASAHKLHGQALEGLGLKEKAMMAYKRSLELEANQADLVLKICDLLCDKDITFDPAKARYWSERACAVFPHSPILFTLKEKLLGSESDMNSADYEHLFQAELKARPSDINVRVKLLNLYLDTNRTEAALNHAFETESKQTHSNQHIWYDCVNRICEAYNMEFPSKCNWEFYMQWISALDRLCALRISEVLSQPTNLVEATEAVYNLDQVLLKGNQLLERVPDMYSEFYKHVTSQLPFHLAALLLRRAKRESSMWKEIKRMVGPLMLFATNDPPNTDAAWSLSVKDVHRKCLNIWAHHAQCRVFEAGSVLQALAKESQTEKRFIDKVTLFATNNWREQIFQKAFRTLDGSNSSMSYFVSSGVYNEVPRKIPSKTTLKPNYFVSSFEFTYVSSLHHLVWLGLQSLVNGASPLTCKLTPIIHTTFFKALQFTVHNLNNTGVETLNQLDIDSFLYATIFCAGLIIEDQKANGFYSPDNKPPLPPDITPLLCTADQSKWWYNACSIIKYSNSMSGVKNKPTDVRQNLQKGIEVVRGEGMPLVILVSLARTFASRAAEEEGSQTSKGCEERALHLWRLAVSQLERMGDKQSLNTSLRTSKVFECPSKDIQASEVLLEEGNFFIACYYMKTEQLEKAIDAFKPLRSPQATYNLALIYQKLAENELHTLRGEEITSEIRSRHVVMATKARDCLYQLRNIIKGDQSHPLQTKLKSKLIEIDDLLSRTEPNNEFTERDGYASEASLSFGSAGSPTGDGTHNNIPQMHHSYSRNRHFPSSTPLRYCEHRHRSNTADIAELLSVHQSTHQLKTQQILEQSRLVLDRLESITFEQRNQRTLIEDLTNKFNKLESEMKTSITEIKQEIKRPDLYNMLDENDYNDDMLHYQNIPFYPQRGVQNTNAMSYGAPVPPFFSPRVDQMYQGNMSFFNQAPLSFPDGQQVSDFLRTMPPSSQINPPLGPKLNTSLGPNLQTPLPLGSGPPSSMQNQSLGSLQTPPKLTPQFSGPSAPNPLRPALLSQGISSQGPTNVVITTSDTLPTGTPPVQPTLSVTIPPQHRLGGSSMLSGGIGSIAAPTNSDAPHNFQIPMPTNIKIVDKSPILQQEQDYSEADEEIVEHDPLPDFQPIIPLPDEVDVKTGEEDERVMFERRAKLFRFVDKQWKDRGVGMLKILKDDSNGKSRILMRRDQVHKICANHFISQDMKLEPMPSSDRAWIWCANDFADEQVQLEKLCVKFKTVEDGELFKKRFEEAKVISDSPHKKETDNAIDAPKPISELFNQAAKTSTTPLQQSEEGRFNILKPPQFNIGGEMMKSNTPKDDFIKPGFLQFSNNEKLNVGGFTFISPPKLKLDEKTEEKVSDEKKTESPFASFTFTPPQTYFEKVSDEKKTEGPFGSFSFSQSQSYSPGQSVLKDLLKPAASPKSILKEVQNKTPTLPKHVVFSSSGSDFSSLSKQEDSEKSSSKPFLISDQLVLGERQNPSNSFISTPSSETAEDDFVPTADFKPVIPLPDLVEFKSGEENEVILFEDRGKLLRFCTETKQWKERGIGKMKILKDPHTNVIRLVMRREQVLKVCCNHRLTKDMVLKPSVNSDKAFTWAAKDYSEEVGRDEIFTLKFKTPEQALAFKEAFESAQAELVPSPKKNEESKETIFGKEKNKSSEAVSTQKQGNNTGDKKNSLSMFLPKTGSWECQGCFIINNSDIIKCPACGSMKPGHESVDEPVSSANTTVPSTAFSFGSGGFQFGAPNKDSVPKFSFGNALTTTTTFSFGVQPTEEKLTIPASGGSTNFMFSSPSTATQPGQKFAFGSKTFHFTMPATSPVKSPLKTDESGSEYEGEDDAGDHIKFTPVVPLPKKITVVTGEEDEEVLYAHRAKLFRYDANSKEWKERGVGDVKILKHNTTEKIRLLMRREPIMKLCLNHYLTQDIDMIAKDNKTWIWHAADFADGEVSNERFALRFKTQDIAQEFKQAVDDAKTQVTGESETSSNDDREPSKSVSNNEQPAVPPEDTSSVGKGHEKTGDERDECKVSSSDDDVEVVFENSVSEEDEKRALALKLPPKFYLYRNAPPCPGCPGCEPSEEETDETETDKSKSNEVSLSGISSQQPKTIFGTPAPSVNFTTGFSFGQALKPVKPFGENPAEEKREVFSMTPQPTTWLAPAVVFGLGNKEDSTPKSFFSQSMHSFSQLPPATTSIFGGKDASNQPPAPGFLDKAADSFSSLAAQAEKKDFQTVTENFKWEGAGQTVFGLSTDTPKPVHNGKKNEKEGAESEEEEVNEEGETKEPDPHFDPIIPLPDEIEVHTGEEDEILLYNERVKLYRYDATTKEWKERGVGNMKLLKHKEKPVFRLLMRRDQVHKIVCNQLITADLVLNKLTTSEQSWCWNAMNLAQDYETPQPEQLAARFKNRDLASSFKIMVQSAIDSVADSKK